MALTEKAVGKPLSRVDGRLKVTGRARYAAESPSDKLPYGVLVAEQHSPSGKIASSTPRRRRRRPACWPSSRTAMRRKPRCRTTPKSGVDPAVGRPLQPLQDDRDPLQRPAHCRRGGRHLRACHPGGRAGPASPIAKRRPSPSSPTAAAHAVPPSENEEEADRTIIAAMPDKALEVGRGPRRADLHHRGRASQSDGAARHRRGLGRAEADPVRQDAMGG